METGWRSNNQEFQYKENNQNNWNSSGNWNNQGRYKNYKGYKNVKNTIKNNLSKFSS